MNWKKILIEKKKKYKYILDWDKFLIKINIFKYFYKIKKNKFNNKWQKKK